jgi:hypothetical protein
MAAQQSFISGKLGPGVGVLLLLVAAAIFTYQLSGGPNKAVIAPQTVFYTDDLGHSFFKDAVKVVPFDHNGKQAYRADVFQGDDGKPFVGLLYRFSDAGRREMENYLTQKTPDPQGLARLAIEHRGMQVSRTGTLAWVSADAETCDRLQSTMRTPAGGAAKLVTP